MKYSEFTSITQVEQKFNIRQQKGILFNNVRLVEPSQTLQNALSDGQKVGLFTEKAKSEFIIAPLLMEVWRNAKGKISLYSGSPLNVESEGLKGYCDYILSADSQSFELKSPIFCLVEAKNRALEEGLGQCAAEMHAVSVYNIQNGTPTKFVFGCVTNGMEWFFLALSENILYVDEARYYLIELPKLLGVFEHIVGQAKVGE